MISGAGPADYKLSGPVFKNATVQEGIEQAVHYSAYKGAELACVTNGREWIIFRSNRIENRPPRPATPGGLIRPAGERPL